MVTHFFYDITHFDSSFFHTIHHLILKPGFLSEEYMKGRRAKYLHPIRMYVFTSAIFFLLFFTFFKPENGAPQNNSQKLTWPERTEQAASFREKLTKDSSNPRLREKITLLLDSSREVFVRDTIIRNQGEGLQIEFGGDGYQSLEQYDSVQRSLPSSERDNWLERRFVRMDITISQKYRDNPEQVTIKILEGFYHRLPYMLFISLPLYALILRLVYVRRRQYFYADHGVFTIHLYIFSFINLLVTFALGKLQEVTGWNFLTAVVIIVFFGMAVYLLLAMRRFYRQGWAKTILKFLIVSLLSLAMMMILFLAFLLFSAASI